MLLKLTPDYPQLLRIDRLITYTHTHTHMYYYEELKESFYQVNLEKFKYGLNWRPLKMITIIHYNID